jgi:hypothetical protein
VSDVMNRPFCIKMVLKNVIYISYLVPLENVRPFIPALLPLAIVERNSVFVSVVIIRCTRVHLKFVPIPQFDYYQFNVRTYVTDPYTGRQAVYFLKSGVTSSLISQFTRPFGLSWQHIDLITYIEESNDYTHFDVKGYWNGDVSVHINSEKPADFTVEPFSSTNEAVNYLIRPLIGFYQWGNRTGRFEIRHPEVSPDVMKLDFLNICMLEEMSIFRSTNLLIPHNVFHVREAQFSIYLPPRRI